MAAQISEELADAPPLVDEGAPRLLVLVNGHRMTELVGSAISAALTSRGFHVELGDASAHPPPPQDYDAVVIGLAVGARRDALVERYLLAFRAGLAEMHAAVFFLGSRRQCARAERLARSQLGRDPDVTAVFPYRAFPWRQLWVEPSLIASFIDRVADIIRT